jgi:hypothetical protein
MKRLDRKGRDVTKIPGLWGEYDVTPYQPAAKRIADLEAMCKRDTELIYLASPYTHRDPDVQERRFRAACQHAAHMLRAGRQVFSPIVHGHPICRHGLPGDWIFWEPFCRTVLERCDRFVILKLPGWETSAGIANETEIAAELKLPVEHEDPMPWVPKRSTRAQEGAGDPPDDDNPRPAA